LERTQYSRHSGSLGISHEAAAGWQWAMAYYGASGDGFQQSRYGRTDLTVTKSGSLDGARWSATLGLRRLDSPLTTYSQGSENLAAIGPEDLLSSRYANRLQGFFQLSVRLP
jgi:iron complex outermembrane receptor protein